MFGRKIQNGSLKTAVIILLLALLAGCVSVTTSLYLDIDGDTSSVPAVEYKQTLSYRVLVIATKIRGYKKIYEGDPENVIAYAQKFNNGLRQLPPNNFYRRFIVTETDINGRPCFLITPKQNVRTDKAVVFLYGSGFMLGIDFYHWDVIKTILTELSVPVFVPLHPIYPETNPDNIFSFLDEAFTHMYAAYPGAHIIGLGNSSGAYILLSYCHYLTKSNAARFPDRLILVSPGQVTEIDEVTLNEMKVIEKNAPEISIDILKNLTSIFNLNDDDENWFRAPLFGDFSRFPPISVFTSTHDMFYPLILPFAERVRLQGKAIELYIGIGLMHNWPYLPIAIESKHALSTILDIIRMDMGTVFSGR